MLFLVFILGPVVVLAGLESRPLVDGRGFLRDVYPVLDYVDDEASPTSAAALVKARTRCYMRGRQVPGDGACLFHALSAGLWFSMNGTHHPMDRKPLREQSLSLRQAAVDVLEDSRDPWLYMGDRERLRASKLLQLAAEQCGQSPREYCHKLRKPHAWGGGPEIVALSNALRRPIHVYELLWAVADLDDHDDDDDELRSLRRRSPRWCLKCIAEFGSPRFEKKTPPVHILSCDSRFPNLSPEQMLDQGNHFLLLFDCDPREATDAAKSAGATDDTLRIVEAHALRRAATSLTYRKHLKTTALHFDDYFHHKKSLFRQTAELLAAPLLFFVALKKVPFLHHALDDDGDHWQSVPAAGCTY